MSKYEKLGNFLLFEKLEEDKLSKNFLAGQIVNNQIQQFSLLKKFDRSLSTMPDFILDLNQELEVLKSLANPNIVRPNTLVQDKSEFAAVFEYVEGKSLRSILNKCQQDGYPFTADHALLVGSRICTALEYLHSKKLNDERLIHGFISPETVWVTYDGEIKLQYLGLSQVLMRFPAGRDKLIHDYRNYLAPEIVGHSKLDKGADIYSTGLVLLEMLSGEPATPKSREAGAAQMLENAQMFLTSGEKVPMGDDIKKVLQQALATDPAERYASVSDMRKTLDQLLFTSDYAPTTFNLAFFMHSLFRESIEEETKSLAGFKKVDVATVVKEEPPPPPPRKPEPPVGAEAAKDIGAIPLSFSSGASVGEPAMFGAVEEVKEKSKTPLFAGILIGVAVLGAIGYFLFKPSTPGNAQNAPSGMTAEQMKADAAERQKLQAEAQKAQEDAKAKDQALKDLQAKLDALMKQQQKQKDSTVDPAQIKQLQEQARKLEEEKKQQQALADEKLKAAQQQQQAATANTAAPETVQPAEQKSVEQKPAEQKPADQKVTEQKTAEQKTVDQKPAEQKPTQIASATLPAPQPAANTTQNPPPTSAEKPAEQQPADTKPAVKEGDIVELTPDVVRPEPVSKMNPIYPAGARARRIEGTVIVSVLISEKGDVSDVKVLRGAGSSAGLNEAAVAAIKKWKFRPAVKDGKRVKVWLNYPFVFKLGQ